MALVAFSSIILFVSCSGEKDRNATQSDSLHSQLSGSAPQAKSDSIANTLQNSNKPETNTGGSKQFTEAQFKSLFPVMEGFKTFPNNFGRIQEDNHFTTVFAQKSYISNSKEEVALRIADFGNNPEIPFIDVYKTAPADKGIKKVKLNLPNCIGHYYYTNKGKFGELHLLINHRFGLEIRVFSTERPEELLKLFFQTFDLKKFDI